MRRRYVEDQIRFHHIKWLWMRVLLALQQRRKYDVLRLGPFISVIHLVISWCGQGFEGFSSPNVYNSIDGLEHI